MKYRSPLDKLANHKCTRCWLHEYTDRVCVMGDGDPDSRIMILGEAPGEQEEVTGRVFAGRAGQLLDAALESAGLRREDVYVSNVVKCRPPDNDRPDRASWESCAIYLEREYKRVRPTHVLLLGNSALQAVARKSGITRQRGRRLEVSQDPWRRSTIMATIHPAFVLRNPGQQATFSEDIRRFARAVKGEFQAETVKPYYVATAQGLRVLRRILEQAEVIAYDVENRYYPWYGNEWWLVCLGLTVDGKASFVVPLRHPQSPFRKRWRQVLAYLRPAIERRGVKLVAQNGKHDNLQLAGAGIYLEHSFDIMLAAHLLDENRPKNLGFLSQTVLGADEYKGMVETKPDKILNQSIRDLARYNAYDTGYTGQIYPKLRSELIEQPRLTRVFTKLMMPASHMIQQVEARGMYVSQKRLYRRMDKVQSMIEDELSVIEEWLPEELVENGFNPNSTQQLGRWLFSSKKKGGLGLKPLILTPTGMPSTKEAVLLHYREHPAIRSLMRYRTLQLKWMNTYLLPWSLKLDPRSRIHTIYKLYGTVTGRLSGDMQQVPRDNFIRSIIGAPKGYRFISADFSQIELRIAAHVSRERRMIRAFETGEDIHLSMAAQLTGKMPQEVSKEERKLAKAVNFGFVYGMYPKKFQAYAFENYALSLSMGEAELARQRFFEMFPDLLSWHERQRNIVHARHWVQSPIGRVRHLPDILSGDNQVRMEAERQAINSPVQSCASDMMLFAMVLLHKQLPPGEAFLVGTLHDGIFLEAREEIADEVAATVKETMENLPLRKTFGFEPRIPIIADVEVSQFWKGNPDAAGLGV